MVADTCLWMVNDLDAIPNDGGWTRYEIVAGELLVTRSPHIRHQSAASSLNTFLGTWSKATRLGRVFHVTGVIFTPTNAVIPDLIWISRDRLASGIDDTGHLVVAPELIVEVLSPGTENERRDKETKLRLYSQHGVLEYWIVSWQRQTLDIYRQSDRALKLASTLEAEDTLSSPLLPGFSVSVALIFQ